MTTDDSLGSETSTSASYGPPFPAALSLEAEAAVANIHHRPTSGPPANGHMPIGHRLQSSETHLSDYTESPQALNWRQESRDPGDPAFTVCFRYPSNPNPLPFKLTLSYSEPPQHPPHRPTCRTTLEPGFLPLTAYNQPPRPTRR